jgi:hypothetical protein
MQIGLKYLSERQTGSNSLTLSHSVVGNLPFAAADFVISRSKTAMPMLWGVNFECGKCNYDHDSWEH